MKKEIPLIKFFIIILDCFLFFLALILTLTFRFGLDISQRFNEHFLPFLFLLPLYILSLIAFDLYNFYLLNFKNLFFRSINFFLIAFIFSTIYFYFNEIIFSISPKTNLFIFLTLFMLFIILSRVFLIKVFFLKEKTPVYFLGSNDLREKLEKDLQGHSFFVFENFEKNKMREGSILVIDKILNLENKNFINKILTLKITPFDFIDFYEKFFYRLPLEAINFDFVLKEILFTETRIYFYLKRFFDLILALFLFLFLFLPLFPLISILIYLNSPGPIFFLQERIGYRGKIFKLIKFRTMKGEANGQKWAVGDEEKRIFLIGKILRKYHLDELPQVINVLKGELSFVGPRPEQPKIANDLEKNIPFYNLRYLVKPGFTGWAQVNFKYPENFEETKIKLEYDLYYLKNNNLFLDILIVIKTFQKLIGF